MCSLLLDITTQRNVDIVKVNKKMEIINVEAANNYIEGQIVEAIFLGLTFGASH